MALMVSENVIHDHITSASFPVHPGTETRGLSKRTLGPWRKGRDSQEMVSKLPLLWVGGQVSLLHQAELKTKETFSFPWDYAV